MNCLERNEISEWARERGLITSDGFVVHLPPLPVIYNGVYAQGRRSGEEGKAAADLVNRLGAWQECVVWVREWGVWPSGEDWPTFYAWRGGAGGTKGEWSSLETPSVWIDDTQAQRAQMLIAEMTAKREPAPAPVQPRVRSSSFAGGLLLGVLIGGVATAALVPMLVKDPGPRSSESWDLNGDGRADNWARSDTAGRLIESSEDHNHDGTPDSWLAYEPPVCSSRFDMIQILMDVKTTGRYTRTDFRYRTQPTMTGMVSPTNGVGSKKACWWKATGHFQMTASRIDRPSTRRAGKYARSTIGTGMVFLKRRSPLTTLSA
jgi:hypothetical protein